MNIDDVRLLLEYHYWARDRMLDAVAPLTPEQFTRDLGSSFPSIRDTLVHLYGAERIWCSRWEGQAPVGMPEASAFPDVSAVRTAWRDQESRIRSVVERFGDDVARVVPYERNGVRYAEPFWQMFQHVVNHGSYHRGQITTMLRQVGAQPSASVDLIVFYRERANMPA